MYFLSKMGKLTSHRYVRGNIGGYKSKPWSINGQAPQLVLGQKVEFSMQRLQAGSEVANLPAAQFRAGRDGNINHVEWKLREETSHVDSKKPQKNSNASWMYPKIFKTGGNKKLGWFVGIWWDQWRLCNWIKDSIFHSFRDIFTHGDPSKLMFFLIHISSDLKAEQTGSESKGFFGANGQSSKNRTIILPKHVSKIEGCFRKIRASPWKRFFTCFFHQTDYCWGSQCFLSVSALDGMLCPPRWSCLSLVSGLVSQLVSHLVWDAVSASLVLSFSSLRSCLPACLPSGLGCCVRLAGLVFL